MSVPARAVVRRPVLTEKSMRGTEAGKYTFEVAPGFNKLAIKAAVEELFHVRVTKVNVLTLPGRTKRRGAHTYRTGSRRKAIVTLRAGDKIDLESLT